MMKSLAFTLLIALTLPAGAHEISSRDQQNLPWLSQMVKLHAQKLCGARALAYRDDCEAEQIKSLAATVAAMPALRPARLSVGQFALMIESHAVATQRDVWSSRSAYAETAVDCRIDVC